jgi:hypothetical protein
MNMSKFSNFPLLYLLLCERASLPIPFVSKLKKMDKVDGPDVDKTEWTKLEFLMDPDNASFKCFRHFVIFKDGCTEEWIKWVMAFREIENLIASKEPADKTRMFRTLLKGQALSHFEHHLMRRLQAENSDVPDNDLIELVLGDISLEYIHKHTICVEKYYMRQTRGL